jgi:hypothetical protein
MWNNTSDDGEKKMSCDKGSVAMNKVVYLFSTLDRGKLQTCLNVPLQALIRHINTCCLYPSSLSEAKQTTAFFFLEKLLSV